MQDMELKRLGIRQRNCRSNYKKALKNGTAKQIMYYQKATRDAEAAYRAYRAVYFGKK